MMFGRSILVALLLTGAAGAAPVLSTSATQDPYWQAGRDTIAARLQVVNRPAHAKNVILFIGDGMGISTITAARIFDAQERARKAGTKALGEENSLSFEKMPFSALVKTYNTDAQVSDSAGTASAMNTGIKTRIGYINFRQDQTATACATPDAWPRTLAEIAKGQGMAVGVVTNTRLTHATPAAVYAHVPNRNWEGADKSYPVAERAAGCPDIASQLVNFRFGTGIDPAMGGGRAKFQPKDAGGSRDDGKDLVAEWTRRYPSGHYLGDAAALRALKPGAAGPVLGLFSPDHMSYETDRDPAKQPSLTEMTAFAIARLAASSPKGYYLMVEGGRIDHGHHASNPYRALSETQQFSQAIAAALSHINLDETLVLVTADHSHTLTIAGYPKRGNDILGYIQPALGGEGGDGLDEDGNAIDDRGVPMATLGYQNGPWSGTIEGQKLSPRLAPTDKNFITNKLHGTGSESHGGEDVALFATGPSSNLVGGVIEQNVIFHVMAQALGWK